MKKINCMNKDCKKLTQFQPKELFSFCAKCKAQYKKVLKETNVWIKQNPNDVRQIMEDTNKKHLDLYEQEKEQVLEQAQKKGVN